MSNYITIQHDEIKVDDENHKSILFIFDDEEVWIPRSIIEDYDDSVVEVQEWFAIKFELEGYAV